MRLLWSFEIQVSHQNVVVPTPSVILPIIHHIQTAVAQSVLSVLPASFHVGIGYTSCSMQYKSPRRHSLPSEEPVGVVPLLGNVQVEPIKPTALGWGLDRLDAHVGEP